ncbi:NAD(P)-dependent oxidoreductase [Breoghania sp. L-A4]|uniref:NAD(P)-dependent oxidoreductase n=1 Tax=Breoghania sp. L-A4 TaxID=2304600 RepID=UPI000E35DECC|nr:NAD(P)-dependent oxidoreductase [Breoghania sp. L-A4]AXS42341.1 NAD(P)-dependent oxidoreductase [Breoghania sp. L-A4]
MTNSSTRIALIGFGEAGGILGADLAKVAGVAVAAYDIKLDDPQTASAMRAKIREAQVEERGSLEALLADADIVISAVTASAARGVAQAAGPKMRAGQSFLDINSVAPETKRANAGDIEASGAAYVDVAVMAPVPPKRLGVPMLLGGASADKMAETLTNFGVNARAVSTDVGYASAIKMCRSIMIKGLEALTVECTMTARHYGVEEPVLASLQASFPGMGWDGELPDYLVSRVAEHGRRRAEELREVVVTVADSGQEPRMAPAIAAAQDALVDSMEEAGIAYEEPFSWRALADTLRR